MRIVVTKRQGCAVIRNSIKRKILSAFVRSAAKHNLGAIFRESSFNKKIKLFRADGNVDPSCHYSNFIKVSISGHKSVIQCRAERLDEICRNMLKHCYRTATLESSN